MMADILSRLEYFHLRELFSPTFPKRYISILNKTKHIWSKMKNIDIQKDKYKNLFQKVYDEFFLHYRFEYIYKNELLKYILEEEKYKNNDISAITEIRVGDAKADFVFVNGCSDVFEIKTPLDTLNRLNSQLSSYFKVFDKVSVLTDKKYINSLKEFNYYKYLGIYIIENRKIMTIKEPKLNICPLDYVLAFNILRKEEYIKVINEEFNMDISNLPNIKLVFKARELFSNINETKARRYIRETLKNRNLIDRIKIKKCPSSLSLMVNNIKNIELYNNFTNILNNNIGEL